MQKKKKLILGSQQQNVVEPEPTIDNQEEAEEDESETFTDYEERGKQIQTLTH